MAMPILRVGLMLGSLGFLYVSWMSTKAGFPVEIALVRGMLAFMAFSFVAYVAELVVATAPGGSSDAAAATAAGNADGAAAEPTAAAVGNAEMDPPEPALLVPMPTRSDNEEREAA